MAKLSSAEMKSATLNRLTGSTACAGFKIKSVIVSSRCADPSAIVSDNGTKLTSRATIGWQKHHGIQSHSARRTDTKPLHRVLQGPAACRVLNEHLFSSIARTRRSSRMRHRRWSLQLVPNKPTTNAGPPSRQGHIEDHGHLT